MNLFLSYNLAVNVVEMIAAVIILFFIVKKEIRSKKNG